MKQRPDTSPPIQVTLICHRECRSCMDLLVELEPLRKLTYVAFKVVDVSRENPPHYAQAFIVPATYIGERLWRYGRFPQQALHIRLQQEINHAKLD